jgi:hypothetical protein
LDPFDYYSGAISTPSTITGGTKNYTPRPKYLPSTQAADLFYTRGSRLDFTVENGGAYRSASIFLRQVNYGIETNEASSYLADGTTTHSFTVTSNPGWSATVSDPNNELVAGSYPTSGGAGSTNFTFKLQERVNATASGTTLPQDITVTFTSPNGEFPARIVTITSHALYLRLAQTTYTTSNYAAHDFTVNLNTNITSNITAAITQSPDNLLSNPAPAILGTPPAQLQVHVGANVEALERQYKVAVRYKTSVIVRTLTVTVPTSIYEIIDNRLVTTATYNYIPPQWAYNGGGTVSCPDGSTPPRTQSENDWYMINVDGPVGAYGTWIGAFNSQDQYGIYIKSYYRTANDGWQYNGNTKFSNLSFFSPIRCVVW